MLKDDRTAPHVASEDRTTQTELVVVPRAGLCGLAEGTVHFACRLCIIKMGKSVLTLQLGGSSNRNSRCQVAQLGMRCGSGSGGASACCGGGGATILPLLSLPRPPGRPFAFGALLLVHL